MKRIIFMLVLIAAFAASLPAAMTSDSDNYLKKMSHAGSGNKTLDPIYLFMAEVEAVLEGTTGWTGGIYITPQSAAATEREGQIYYDSDNDNLYVYANGGWVDLTAAAASTVTDLDTAYNGGNSMTVDGSAVTLTGSHSANDTFFVNKTTGTGDAIQITNAGLGYDIQGTSNTWQVTKTGALTAVSVQAATLIGTGSCTIGEGTGTVAINSSGWDITTAGAVSGISTISMTDDITMATGTSLKSSTTTAETVSLQGYDVDNTTYRDMFLITNGDTLAGVLGTGTGTVAVETSTWDVSTAGAFTGVADITGTAGEAMTITLAADGAADDLTISVTGAQNSSLLLASAGTGADAISLTTSAGGMDLTVAGAAANEDLDLLANTSVNITGAEADAAAIVLNASNAAGGIDIDYGTGNMVITGTGASADFSVDCDLFSIDGTGTSNVTVTSTAGAEDFTIALAGAFDSSLILSSTGTAADALQITASAGGIDMTSLDDLDLQVTSSTAGEDLKLTQVGANDSSILLAAAGTGTDAIGIAASAGGITMSSTAVASAWTHTATGAADDLTISVAGNVDSSLVLTSAGSGTDALTVSTTANAGDIVISSNDKIDMDSVGTFALNAAGDTLLIQVDSDGAADDLTIKVDGDDDSSIVLDSDGTAADAIKINASNAAGGIDIDCGTGGFALDVAGGAFSVTGQNAASDLTLTANGDADDLTFEVAGAFNASVLVKSAGTGADAVGITTSGTGGGISLDTADGAVAITADGASNGDITIDAEDDLTLTSTGDTIVTGQVAFQTIKVGQKSYTRSTSLTFNDSNDVGTVQVIDTNGVTVTLPAVATGLTYRVMCGGADGTVTLNVDVNGSDKILGGCSFGALDDGDMLTLTKATAKKGDYVELTYGNANGWYITDMVGIWVDGS